MAIEKLKPCPCCGGVVSIENVHINYVNVFSIICSDCSIIFTAYEDGYFFDDDKLTIEKWNKRCEGRS